MMTVRQTLFTLASCKAWSRRSSNERPHPLSSNANRLIPDRYCKSGATSDPGQQQRLQLQQWHNDRPSSARRAIRTVACPEFCARSVHSTTTTYTQVQVPAHAAGHTRNTRQGSLISQPHSTQCDSQKGPNHGLLASPSLIQQLSAWLVWWEIIACEICRPWSLHSHNWSILKLHWGKSYHGS